ncbi:hypothetical protein ZWY2020_004565 [Hordeum vulgare]|nr:hypothetical protein ZWY2020_004565 [Hordeum vulgare]
MGRGSRKLRGVWGVGAGVDERAEVGRHDEGRHVSESDHSCLAAVQGEKRNKSDLRGQVVQEEEVPPISMMAHQQIGWRRKTKLSLEDERLNDIVGRAYYVAPEALAKTLIANQLFYLKEQFELLGPNKSGYISLHNLKSALVKNSTDTMKDYRAIDFVNTSLRSTISSPSIAICLYGYNSCIITE